MAAGKVDLLQEYELQMEFYVTEFQDRCLLSVGEYYSSKNVTKVPKIVLGTYYGNVTIFDIDYSFGSDSSSRIFIRYHSNEIHIKRNTLYRLTATHTRQFRNYYLDDLRIISVDLKAGRCDFEFGLASFCSMRNVGAYLAPVENATVYLGSSTPNKYNKFYTGFVRNLKFFEIN